MAKEHDIIRARVAADEKRRAKALCALNDWDLQDWAGEAIRRQLAEDEAKRDQERKEATDGDHAA